MANSHVESRTRQTDRAFRDIVEKDRAAVLAKTARLRALRLSKEAEEAKAIQAAPSQPQPGSRAKRKAAS